MKLYYGKGACSLAPHIVLEELGLPYEAKLVDIYHGENEKPEFLRINPMGAVPVLELDSGEIVTEVAVILQYLADLRPEAGLAPRNGTLERVRLQETLNFIATEIHKGFAPLFAARASLGESGDSEQLWSFGMGQLEPRLDVLVQKLGSREFLQPQGYGVADAYLYVVMGWSRFLKVDLSRWPAITAHMARVHARPATQRALKAEGMPTRAH